MTERKFRVLVVDDDEMLCEMLVAMLSREYEVQTAGDGVAALEKIASWTPDLVIIDLMMPRMHGYELCGRLKGPGGLKGLMVLVVSAKSFPADIAQARSAGADAYLTKPLDMGTLLAKARQLLSGGEPEPAPAAAPSHAPAAAPAAPKAPPGARLPLSVKFWGTRGSSPVSGHKTLHYGGNTACVELRAGEHIVIIDCGTGLRELGLSMVKEFKDRPIDAHILVGHTHWDHIQGFPFFAPLYNPRNSFNIYSVHGRHPLRICH